MENTQSQENKSATYSFGNAQFVVSREFSGKKTINELIVEIITNKETKPQN